MQASADFVRTPNLLVRSLFPLEATPGLISLLAGKPNPSTFPFTSLSFTARSPTDPSKESEIKVDSGALAAGLQYGATSGYPQLCEWVYGLQEIMHGRKRGEGWHLSIGSGSQDLIFKVCPLSLSRCCHFISRNSDTLARLSNAWSTQGILSWWNHQSMRTFQPHPRLSPVSSAR